MERNILASTGHDTIELQLLIMGTSGVLPISVIIADKGYDNEENHVLFREHLCAFCIIPTRYWDVPNWRTHGSQENRRTVVIPTYSTIRETNMKPYFQ